MSVTKSQVLDPRVTNSRIGIIDNELSSLSSAISALRAHGFQNLALIEQVHSLRGLLSEGFDLVVLDILDVLGPALSGGKAGHPGGLEVLNYLKDRDPTVEVVVLSGGRYGVDDLAGFERADRVLQKPFLSSRLVRVVEEVLVQHHSAEYQGRRALEDIRRILLQSDGVPPGTRYKMTRSIDKVLSADTFSPSAARSVLEKAEKYVGSVYYSAKILAMLGELLA